MDSDEFRRILKGESKVKAGFETDVQVDDMTCRVKVDKSAAGTKFNILGPDKEKCTKAFLREILKKEV